MQPCGGSWAADGFEEKDEKKQKKKEKKQNSDALAHKVLGMLPCRRRQRPLGLEVEAGEQVPA